MVNANLAKKKETNNKQSWHCIETEEFPFNDDDSTLAFIPDSLSCVLWKWKERELKTKIAWFHTPMTDQVSAG